MFFALSDNSIVMQNYF